MTSGRAEMSFHSGGQDLALEGAGQLEVLLSLQVYRKETTADQMRVG